MLDYLTQQRATIAADGSLTIPATLLRTLVWRPGQQVLLEQTDDGLLVTETGTPDHLSTI